MRRGEEGQALVLIALVALGLVAMVGLSVDGGIAYLASNQLQRSADAASLAGVVWVVNNRPVADARAGLAAEANGVKVACYYDQSGTNGVDYNNRCKRVSLNDLRASKSSDDFYYMETDAPQGQGIFYSVKLIKRQQRLFLGFLGLFQKGFDEFDIVRSSTASFSRLVRFGASFNYFGTNGVFYDHYMRCGNSDLAKCAGNTSSDLIMRGATYQKYVVMRCDQANAPSPCIGGFWGHIAGPDLTHSNGDAYTPIRDGATGISGSCGITGNSCVGGGAPGANCIHSNDADYSNGRFASWFINSIFTDSGGTCTQSSGGLPVVNYDIHPDAPQGQRGFGYELAVEVDPLAIYSYKDTVSNVTNHTNLNITVYDGSINEMGGAELGTGDSYQSRNSIYSAYPHSTVSATRAANANAANQWNTKKLICSPGSSPCSGTAAATPNYPTPQRVPAGDKTISDINGGTGYSALFPDQNNVELTYNDIRTRFTLYAPPVVPAIPSTYGNVAGNRIASFEATDVSLRRNDGTGDGSNQNYNFPLTSYNSINQFCYFIFDDQKAYWNNTRDNNGSQNNPIPTGTGPDFASAQAVTNRYSYVCPGDNNTISYDYRWNSLKGTPTARYGTTFNSTRTIESGILPQDYAAPLTFSDIITSPVVSATIGGQVLNQHIVNNKGQSSYVYSTVGLSNIDPRSAGVNTIWSPTVTTTNGLTYANVVDISQSCYRSAVGTDGWPLDALWGHNRIPFNAAYNDPLVDRAWVTDTTKLASSTATSYPVDSGKLAGYYTLAYGFHGWRCDWDFDSNYTLNPLQNPNSPPGSSNLSLSQLERLSATSIGQYDRAFVENHPGLVKNSYMAQILGGDSATNASICHDLIPEGASFYTYCGGTAPTAKSGWQADQDFGLEPFFHLTNVQIANGGIGVISATETTAPMRAGTYMVHVQVFGGNAANRYSLKAEYENPRIKVEGGINITPVPNVYAITAMALYANNQNSGTVTDQNIVFDLANIPPENAGTLAIVELFDPGDIGSGTLSLEIRKPSGWGPRIDTNNSSNPTNWKVPWPTTDGAYNDPILTRLTVCPFTLIADSSQLAANCVTSSQSAPQTSWDAAVNGRSNYNDDWVLFSFSILSSGEYSTIQSKCALHNVPESLCYYYQINYHLNGAGAKANDTTTWQLVVQGQPIHLVQ